MQIDPAPQVEKLFQMFDKERSGQIDVREFMIGLSNFTGAGKDDKLKFAFMVFDEDGNGVITKQELVKILKANHMATNESEVARKAETIMSQADKDGDGVVSFDEFVVVSKKFPNILFVRTTLAAAAPKSLSRPVARCSTNIRFLTRAPLLAATACVPHGPRSLSSQRATCACSMPQPHRRATRGDLRQRHDAVKQQRCCSCCTCE
jgi:serine/threonine-protein phosphatase 2B regulatory subunit